MCGGGSAPKPPKQPPAQPPPIIEAAPEVQVGNQSDTVSNRRKVGRSQLKQSASSGAAPSGLGS